jgi:hypothetical protein
VANTKLVGSARAGFAGEIKPEQKHAAFDVSIQTRLRYRFPSSSRIEFCRARAYGGIFSSPAATITLAQSGKAARTLYLQSSPVVYVCDVAITRHFPKIQGTYCGGHRS